MAHDEIKKELHLPNLWRFVSQTNKNETNLQTLEFNYFFANLDLTK